MVERFDSEAAKPIAFVPPVENDQYFKPQFLLGLSLMFQKRIGILTFFEKKEM